MNLTDALGHDARPGFYYDAGHEDPSLNYAFVAVQTEKGISFDGATFPPVISCLSPETQMERAIPLSEGMKTRLVEKHGQPFLDWMDRLREKYPYLPEIL